MTKAELIERIARSRTLPPDITKKDIDRIVTLAFEELATYFARTKVTRAQSPRFAFPHFGTFTKKRRRARQGVNPRTLEPMQIDAYYSLDFRPSAELRDAMNVVRTDADAPSRRRRSVTPAFAPVVDDELETLAADDGEVEAAMLPEPPLARVRSTRPSRAKTG